MPRWRVGCDACDAGGWIGPRPAPEATIFDAWCEGCQTPHALSGVPTSPPTCPRCGAGLTLGELRFEDLLGELQNLTAVLHAWCGDAGPLATLLPGRPGLLTDPDPPRPQPGDPAEVGAEFEALARDRFARERWNRAALLLMAAVAAAPGLPEVAILRRAREEAGEPSSYWSDPTVGRLLWTLLVERALAAGPGTAAADDEKVMRAAEHELEFSTFWDRALVVHGYAALEMKEPAADAAAALAGELLAGLVAQPFARDPAGTWVSAPLAGAEQAVRERRPGDALAALRDVMERPDVRHYRVPCLACGHGSLGVESFEDAGAAT